MLLLFARCAGLAACCKMGRPGRQRRNIAAIARLSLVTAWSCCIQINNKATAWIINNGNVLRTSHHHPRQQRFSTGTHQRLPSTASARTRMAVSTTSSQKAAITSAPTTSSNGSSSLPASTAIVGGGPTGLAVALMLARRGYRNVCVYERLPEPPPPASAEWGNPERSYNLGIGGRGQAALAKLGAAEKVLSWCADAVGRKDWNPQSPEGAERIFSERKYKTKVIARDRLASCLLEQAREEHSDAISVKFDVECTGARWLEPEGGTGGTLILKNASTGETSDVTADLVVAADGVRSAIRDGLERDGKLTRALSGGEMRVKRFPRKNDFAYKVVPFKLDAGWRNDFNYSHRTKGDITLEALPTKEGMQVGVLLFRPDDERVLGLKTAAEARALFQELFPQFADMITEEAYERLALQEVSRLPNFSYTGPILHLGRSAVLLGDAIKSVKPYFGLGVNTAFEDCMALDRCLEETGDDLSKALPLYSSIRAPEAKDLVELSRGFDRTGVAGIFGFILPLIVDSICHKTAPWLFAPNTIAFLQREGMTFRRIRLRKALDRVTQGMALVALGATVFVGCRAGVRALWPLVVAALAR